MSKSKGNSIDPLIVMEQYGTDAFRFTLAAFAAQGRDIKLSEERIEGYRHFTNKIWNASRFALLNLKGFDGKAPQKAEYALADKWITSRLQKTIQQVRHGMEEFRFNEAANAIYQFIWHELCDWYIELIKTRLLDKEEKSGLAARHTLCTVLDNSLKLLHPFMPFITEEIWQFLPHEGESIMIAKFPVCNPEMINETAEKDMKVIMDLLSGIRNVRGEMNINPSKKLDVMVHIENAYKKSLLERETPRIKELARLTTITIKANGIRPKNSAASVVDDIELFIPLAGVLNFEEEEKRIKKELNKVEKELTAINKKLSNRSFTEKAPKKVIVKNEDRQHFLLEKKRRLKRNMSIVKKAL